jgi:SSS family solute:Na+ symporter
MMGLSWGTLAGCFIGPFVLGLFSRKITRAAAWSSVVGSLLLTVALILFFGYHKNGFSVSFGKAIADGVGCSPLIGVICMLFSVIITVAVSLLTRKPTDEILYDAFDKPIENEIK